MKRFLVADIGGTNARFALASPGPRLDAVRIMATSEYATFEACLEAYLAPLAVDGPLDATLAVAGPVVDNAVAMTNLGWRVDGAMLAAHPALGAVRVINDFVAMAWATEAASELDLLAVKGGKPHAQGSRLVIGPGTGLGVGALVPADGRWVALPGEGGHVACPPYTSFPPGVFDALQAAHRHLYLELVLSGRGLVHLDRALHEARGMPPVTRSAEAIGSAATEGEATAAETVDIFCLVLAEAARDFALTFAALGGVFLAGGILPKVEARLTACAFEQRFTDHPNYRELLGGIPVHLIRHGHAAMLGAAAFALAADSART